MWVPRPYDASVDLSVLLHQLRLWCVVILRMTSDPPSSVHGVGPSLICAWCRTLPHLCMVSDPPSSVHGVGPSLICAWRSGAHARGNPRPPSCHTHALAHAHKMVSVVTTSLSHSHWPRLRVEAYSCERFLLGIVLSCSITRSLTLEGRRTLARYPPMLNDTHRTAVWDRAITAAIARWKSEKGS
jgi:hypothetical protein